jgi:hypothetical protein
MSSILIQDLVDEFILFGQQAMLRLAKQQGVCANDALDAVFAEVHR